MPDFHVVILSDYAKGTLTGNVIKAAINAAKGACIPIIVDPKSRDFRRYAGATIITPNVKELAAATGIEATTNDLAAHAATCAMTLSSAEAILLTRSEHGMTLVRRDETTLHIPTVAREVFDVVGAGDTVVAALSLCLGLSYPIDFAATVSNVAAGIVVGKRGTAVVTKDELLTAIFSQTQSSNPIEMKHFDLVQAKIMVSLWKQQGYKVGFTNGCFDILHAGHIKLINFSKSHCDRLIVAINSDASVRRLKGQTRPINNEDDRATLLASLVGVDAVVSFDDDTPANIINTLIPDVLIKGADYSLNDIVGADVVNSNGGIVLRCEILEGRSTTNILARGAMGNAQCVEQKT